jgi:SAM-dependent methyltransferase
MQYEPIKALIGRYCKGRPALRKLLYALIDVLLLRAWHMRKALKIIRKRLPAHASVLDAGSGMGQYSWRLSRMGKNWKIHGIDINASEVSDCREFFADQGLSSRVSFEVLDLAALAHKSAYDFIITVDVMEHIHDDISVFRNFCAALRDKGILLISTPSDKGGSDAGHAGDDSFIDEHVRNGYGIAEITQKLREAGFDKVNASYTYGWPGSLSWKISMKYPVIMLNTSWLFFAVLPLWYLLAMPPALLLNLLDVSLRHRTGTGLIVMAEKEAV